MSQIVEAKLDQLALEVHCVPDSVEEANKLRERVSALEPAARAEV